MSHPHKDNDQAVTKRMIDLLYELIRVRDECEKINRLIHKMSNGNDDFHARIQPLSGNLLEYTLNVLDVYFLSITGSSGLATHAIFETGIIIAIDGTKYNLKERSEFEDFIECCRGNK